MVAEAVEARGTEAMAAGEVTGEEAVVGAGEGVEGVAAVVVDILLAIRLAQFGEGQSSSRRRVYDDDIP